MYLLSWALLIRPQLWAEKGGLRGVPSIIRVETLEVNLMRMVLHSKGGQGSSEETFGGNQNNDGDSQDSNNDENFSSNNPPNINPGESFYQDNPGDDKFPAATPVPEPATLSLLGMGLAAVLLRQRKH